MPRYVRRRGPMRRRKAPKVRRARYARRRVAPKGGTFVVRKVKQLYTSNSLGTLGGYTVSSANNSLALGTPQAVPNMTNVYDVPFTIQFRLDELEQYTEFTSLFDSYKIVSCKVKVQSTFFSSTQTATPVPFIDYIQDHDDNTMPSLSLMRQKMGVKTKYFGSRSNITMGVRPKCATQVYDGLTTAYAVPGPAGTWLNASHPSVPHYAIKGIVRNVFLPATVNTSPLTWDISYGVALKDIQ